MTPQLQAEARDVLLDYITSEYRTFLQDMLAARTANREQFLAMDHTKEFTAPIILIVAPPRCSTTRMQRLLASDPQFQFVSLQKCIHPFSDESIDWLTTWYGKQQELHDLRPDQAAEWSWFISALGNCGYPYGESNVPADDAELFDEMSKLLPLVTDGRPVVFKDTSRIDGKWLRAFLLAFPSTKVLLMLRRDQAARRFSCLKQTDYFSTRSYIGHIESPEYPPAPKGWDKNTEIIASWHEGGLPTDYNLFWMEDLISKPETILDVYRVLGYKCPQSVLDMAIRNEKF